MAPNPYDELLNRYLAIWYPIPDLDTWPMGSPAPEKPKGICSGCGEKNEYAEESDWMCWACRNGWSSEEA